MATNSNSVDDLTGGRGPQGAKSPTGRWIARAAFIALALGGGILIGAMTPPGEWYDQLQKPFFNPPSWLFGPVWTILYALVAIAGWRTWMRNYKGAAMQVWFGQLAVNFLWSPVFFGMQLPGLALLVIAAMITLTVTFIALTWTADRISAWLMTPYLAWIVFAGILNLAIWWMN
ncbi:MULTISPECIES: TspO/MBR family protein [unclassified Roseitalea]|uniref:TspO/MBR family protein n=1 Tax=unclassified Roseitalea TaxID=2639107 RepID=UPI00273F3B35|nr:MULTISPECIES: TspO/MBR family protein [unclassified Roseitalea]